MDDRRENDDAQDAGHSGAARRQWPAPNPQPAPQFPHQADPQPGAPGGRPDPAVPPAGYGGPLPPEPRDPWGGRGYAAPGGPPPGWMPPTGYGDPAHPGGGPPPPRRGRRWALPLSAALVVGIAGAAAGAGIGHATWHSGSSVSDASTNQGIGGSGSRGQGSGPFGRLPSGGDQYPGNGGSGSNGNASGGPSDVGKIAKKVVPALVDVDVTFGYQQAEGAGTGIVLTSDGEILTNNHVIDGATTISVTDVGNGRTYRAAVVGYDSTHDLAVLQLKNASGLTTATIADGSTPSVGQSVVAVGNANGAGGTPSSSGGSITGLNQSITANDELDGTSERLSGLIQTNADIVQGDSGGSLVDTSGAVIGVDVAASSSYALPNAGSQGYAIPIGQAVSIAQQIENGKDSSTIHIGATAFLGVSVTSESQGRFGNNGATGSGALIQGVLDGGTAARAGLAAGDLITALDGHTIGSPTELSAMLSRYHPGDQVSLGWTDASGQQHSATVSLQSGPPA